MTGMGSQEAQTVSADQGRQHFDRVTSAQCGAGLCERASGVILLLNTHMLCWIQCADAHLFILSPSLAQDIIEPLCAELQESMRHDKSQWLIQTAEVC